MADERAVFGNSLILVFGAISFVLGLVATLPIIEWCVDIYAGGLTQAEINQLGEFGTSFYVLIIGRVFGPLIAEGIGLTIYGMGYLIVRRVSYQLNSRRYWLVYPIISLIIMFGYYILWVFGILPFG